jgi:hypothetical protein
MGATRAFALAAILLLSCLPLARPALAAWTQDEFIIGTMWDPRQAYCANWNGCLRNSTQRAIDVASYQQAKDAYFNLLTGHQTGNRILTTTTGMDSNLSVAAEVGMKYMVRNAGDSMAFYDSGDMLESTIIANTNHYKNLPASLRAAHYGYNLGDEVPEGGDSDVMLTKVARFRTHDSTRVSWFLLRPSTQFTRAEYEDYLTTYVSPPDPTLRPDLVINNHYPFRSVWPDSLAQAKFDTTYYYTLEATRRHAGNRSWWQHLLTTEIWTDTTNAHTYHHRPDSPRLRFMVSCPLAYGAKGLIYFTYEQPTDAVSNPRWGSALVDYATGNPNPLYDTVKVVNRYLKTVAGPVTINSIHLGTYHKSNQPTNENLDSKSLMDPNSMPVLATVDNDSILVGIWRSKAAYYKYYLFVVNKSYKGSISNLNVTLKGDRTGSVLLAPRMVGYSGATAYSSPTTTYDDTTHSSTFTIPLLAAGELRIVAVDNVFDYGLTSHHRTDYDADGKADLSYRVGSSGRWRIDLSGNGMGAGSLDRDYTSIGSLTSSQLVPSDYDGDGASDVAIKLHAGTGTWRIMYGLKTGSVVFDSTFTDVGDTTWIGAPADYDGDRRADIALKGHNGEWVINYSSNYFAGGFDVTVPGPFGGSNAVPVPADYDGDGMADLAVKTPDGRWKFDWAANGFSAPEDSLTGLGDATNIPVPADYNGDGFADVAVKVGNTWKIDYDLDGSWDFTQAYTGADTTDPAPGDYDADWRTDIAFRTASGVWKIDYAWNGFGSFDVTNYATYGGASDIALYRQNRQVADDALEFGVRLLENPVRSAARIQLSLPSRTNGRLAVFDLQGRLVRVLHDGALASGVHEIVWDGRSATQERLAAGIYFVSFVSDFDTRRLKLALLP